MSGFKASASNPLKLRTLSTLGQFLNRHKLLQSHLKFFFNHRKFENFETCKDWYFVSLREELWLLSRRAVVIDPSRAVCQENHISHRPLAIPKVQEAYFITQKSVRKKKKKKEKKRHPGSLLFNSHLRVPVSITHVYLNQVTAMQWRGFWLRKTSCHMGSILK